MLIQSGPNAERKVRSALLFILVAVFAFWYAYDGWVGYAKNNLNDFLKTIPAEQRQTAGDIRVYETVNEENILRLSKVKITIADDPETAIGDILGGPPSLKTPDAWYYLGPAHTVRFEIRGGFPTDLTFPKPPHTATDIRWQKNFAYGLFVLAGAALIYVIRVRMARARLDDAGLTLGGGPTVAWDSMKRLDTERFRKKGWVDLVHGEPEETTRIDEYHYAKFNEIIEAICARKGFENPVTRPPDEEPEADSEPEMTPADRPEP